MQHPHGDSNTGTAPYLRDLMKQRDSWLLSDSNKIPRVASNPQQRARTNDPTTHTSYQEALAAVQKDPSEYALGRVIFEDDGFVVVDIDIKGENISDEMLSVKQRIIDLFPDAAHMRSTSGGAHIWVWAPRFKAFAKEQGFKQFAQPHGKYQTEVFMSGRYMRIVGDVDSLEGVCTDYSDVLFEMYAALPVKKQREAVEQGSCSPQKIESVQTTLRWAILSDYGHDYKQWFNVCAALHHEGHARAEEDLFLEMFIDYSMQVSGFEGVAECEAQWRACKPKTVNPLTLGTINSLYNDWRHQWFAGFLEKSLASAYAQAQQEQENIRALTYNEEVDGPLSEDAITQEEESATPREPLPGILRDFEEYYSTTAYTVNPDLAAHSAIMMFAHFTAGKLAVKERHDDTPSFTTLYAIQCVRSGGGKQHLHSCIGKIEKACATIYSAMRPDGSFAGTNDLARLAPNVEFLPSSLQSAHRMIGDPQEGRRSMTFLRDEAAGFFGRAYADKTATSTEKALLDYLLTLHSVNEVGGVMRATQSQTAIARGTFSGPIAEPAVNVVFQIQPQLLKKVLRAEAAKGGLLRRTLVLFHDAQPKNLYRRRDKGLAQLESIKQILSELWAHDVVHVLGPEDEEAFITYQETEYEQLMKDGDSAVAEYAPRQLLLKLAGLLAFAKGAAAFSVQDYRDAVSIYCGWMAPFMAEVGVSENWGKAEPVFDKVMKVLNRAKAKGKPFLFINELCENCKVFRELTEDEQERKLLSLSKRGLIKIEGRKVCSLEQE
jgi:hypothetical protein